MFYYSTYLSIYLCLAFVDASACQFVWCAWKKFALSWILQVNQSGQIKMNQNPSSFCLMNRYNILQLHQWQCYNMLQHQSVQPLSRFWKEVPDPWEQGCQGNAESTAELRRCVIFKILQPTVHMLAQKIKTIVYKHSKTKKKKKNRKKHMCP